MQRSNPLVTALISLGLFGGMIICLEIGRRLGRRRLLRDPEGARAGLGAVEGSLFGLSLSCSVLAGYGMGGGKEGRWTHMLGFASITAVAVYVIVDLEYPCLGLIRVGSADRALIELREDMQAAEAEHGLR